MSDSVDIVQSRNAASSDGPAPRKRRKRAPAAGAAADCFTCSSRSIKCDRRRPYCSQCLDEGKECSGYKTQLTWGVGVASRGKLRGLSLPVAGTKKLERPPPPQKTRKRESGSISQSLEETKAAPTTKRFDPNAHPAKTDDYPRDDASNGLASPYLSHDWPNADQKPASPLSFSAGLEIKSLGLHKPFHPAESTQPRRSPQRTSFPPLISPGHSSNHNRAPSLPYPVSTLGPRLFGQPSSPYASASQSHYSPYSPFTPSFDTGFPDRGPFAAYPRPDESYVRNDAFERPMHTYEQPALHSVFPPPVLDDTKMIDAEATLEEVQRHELDSECAIVDGGSVHSMSLPLDFRLAMTPYSSAHGIGRTPRMQFLVNYYAEVISPVIVAFDGPNNPYRTQILRLAQSSETLQHAISALAASNLRQRKESGVISTGKTDPARRSSMAHLTLTDESWHDAGLLSPQDQAREETFHKNFAIQSLNQQLADPALRKNDSILAVLLILCLFHICDSGVAKFQTQFAGVKKLLSLRGNDLRLNTPETKWFTRMFTWFDAMTASVNDREGQLQGHHLDISALSDEEWSLENLAGCDGQLFKTIAKLGRLNVLSQGKSVESSPTLVCRPLPALPFTSPSLGAADYNNFDGNGWTRITADEDLFTAKTSSSSPEDLNFTEFWREWREIRQTLQTWTLDPTIFDTANPNAPDLTPDQRLDLANISESFRYSALLYTERLANPAAPSTHPSIQAWVRQSLEYIQRVKSDVYLLWPLFITGSECVEELDRAVIRERCLDIQKDSGFLNNKSCLDLIEKIWERSPSNRIGDEIKVEDLDGMKGKAEEEEEEERGFRFTRVMELEGNEGEYIVV